MNFTKSRSQRIIFLSIVSLLFACKEEVPMINQAPGDFIVSVSSNMQSAQLSWSESVDPDGDMVTYAVVLDNDTLSKNISSQSYELSNLTYGTNYSGFVIAFDEERLSKKAAYTFTTENEPNEPPAAFALVAPADMEQFSPLSPMLEWEAALDPDNDPVSYDILLGNPASVIATDITDTKYQLNDLEEETSFTWQVIAKDGRGGETSSNQATFTTRASVIATLETTAPWAGRSDQGVLIYDNKMWVIGGNNGGGARFNDVWYSSDGVNWTEATASAPWAARSMPGSVVFDGKMWVIGGNANYSNGGQFDDVWYSTDGVNWTQALSNAPFQHRHQHEVVVYDGKIWIIGGSDIAQSYSSTQIWNSTDGVNWSLVTDDYGFGFTNTGEVLVYEGKMWLIGGYNDKVRWSTDGLNWTQVTNEAAFGEKINHACTTHDGKMWLMSGSDNLVNQLQETDDVWYSTDGINWIQAAQNAGFDPVAAAASVSFLGKTWLIGGGGGWQSFAVSNKVYSFD